MNILALDPATKCGWALSTFMYGIWDLRTKPDESTGMKLFRFKAKLSEICEKEKIKLVVFERPAGRFNKDIKSHSMFEAIIIEYCISNNIEYKGYSPAEIKKHSTGKGNSNKEEVIKAARNKLNYMGKNDNEADALWLLDLAKTELNVL